MAHDREVAGIRCMEVLDRLSDYLDDSLDTATRDRVESHLRGCDWCEKFGSEVSTTVKALRTDLERDSDDDGVRDRLRARLARIDDRST